MNDLIKRSDAIEAMKPCKHVIFTDKTGNATNIASAINSIPAAPALSELKKVYDGVLARKAARGFTVPDDIHHLLKAIRALIQDTKEG